MANNCAFEINIRAQTTEDADRVVAILQNRDPIYYIIRGWPDSVFEDGGEGTPERGIYGDCPWTAAYMWEPTGTLYGHDIIPGETKLSDGRTLVSIQWLCRTWKMEAWGWEEEAGCEVSGNYRCDAEGNLTYEDTWADFVLEMWRNNGEDWADSVRRCCAEGCYGDETVEILKELETEEQEGEE